MGYLDWSHIWSITVAILLAQVALSVYYKIRQKIGARKTAGDEAG